MSIKTFCDCCGKEANWTKEFLADGVGVVGVYAVDDEKDICLYCVIDALKKLDDRRQPTEWPEEDEPSPLLISKTQSILQWVDGAVSPQRADATLTAYGNGHEYDYKVLWGNDGRWRDAYGRRHGTPHRWAYLP